MRAALTFLVFTTLAGAASAELADVRPPPPPESKHSQWVFTLVPKSMQQHPDLDFHVITEVTAEGRKRPQPTPKHPVYYLAQAGKFMQLGEDVSANEHPPQVAVLEKAVGNALSSSNYQVATPSSPLPTIVVVFNYGSYARFSTSMADMAEADILQSISEDGSAPPMRTGGQRDVDSLLPIVLASPPARTNLLQRAEVVGGEKFSHDLAVVLNEEAKLKQGGSFLFGALRDMTPFHRFVDSSPEIANLVQDSFDGCYFVVASAYDYMAMRQNKRVLLWRTKMAVNASGISMSESFPPLIATAGPYFGREMPGPVILTRKLDREGTVEVGTPHVVEDPQPAAPKPAAPEKH